MSAKAGVITFPGSNGDHDAWYALQHEVGVETRLVDYRETSLDAFDLIVLPGGFSYGDHLRAGAIARFAPVVEPLRRFAERGAPVLGICNGFQVLTEAHLLPGALLQNQSLEFHCSWVNVKVESTRTAWTNELAEGQILRLPVAHGQGSYFADDETLDRLEENLQVIMRYCDEDGSNTTDSNFNGSARSIAGISNDRGNVVGLMPHPERACDQLLGGSDGISMLKSALNALSAAV
ncbi:MAG: phosphoribosylformylglycinamidine synthase subunit PurQ [Thermomicrobiales bacterium]|nr:phosphoribosylformylglycinamidine synthase subunit PurQ [Thermomicrobiales bacterium]